ncbi:MAG: sigma-70 family RNA polymerase sigma factor [Myxococcaceae bacterium]
MQTELADRLFELLDEDASSSERERVERTLTQAASEARSCWPGVTDPPKHWVEHLAHRVNDTVTLEQLALTDLWLACACLEGDSHAHAHLEVSVLSKVKPAIASLESSHAFVEEVLQAVRIKLLSSHAERPPYLTRYAGTGPLSAWARAVALGTGMDLLRQRGKTPLEDDAELLADLASPEDAEVRLIKTRDSQTFRDAFRDALSRLEVQDRTLLRLRFLDGLTTEEIARMFQTHRTTVSRSLQRITSALLKRTREKLTARLKLSALDADQMVGFVNSQLDLSLERLLPR